MLVAAVLVLYTALVITVLAPRLTAARWTDRAPRLAVAVWPALATGLVAAAVLAGAAVGGVAGTGVALGVTARVAWAGGATAWHMLRQRAAHREAVRLVGHYDPGLDATVIPAAEPAAYCLPGSRRLGVVITTGALAALGTPQLIAVLAHERAHLRSRHGLVLGYVHVLARAFPRIGVFRVAEAETARLVEMAADDAASAATARVTVAAALLTLARGARRREAPGSQRSPIRNQPPSPRLAAATTTVAHRVRRLLSDPPPPSRRLRFAVAAATAGLLVFPLFLTAVPAVVTCAAHRFQGVPEAAAGSSELDT